MEYLIRLILEEIFDLVSMSKEIGIHVDRTNEAIVRIYMLPPSRLIVTINLKSHASTLQGLYSSRLISAREWIQLSLQ